MLYAWVLTVGDFFKWVPCGEGSLHAAPLEKLQLGFLGITLGGLKEFSAFHLRLQ